MRRVAWTTEALDDLAEITGYIADRNPAAAERIEALCRQTASRLSLRPKLHRPGRAPDTREAVVHPNYIMVYRFDDELVRILAVLHARQRYP